MKKALTALFMAAGAMTAQAQGLQRGPQHDVLTLNSGRTVEIPHCADERGQKVRFALMPAGTLPWSIFSTYTPTSGSQVLMTQAFLDVPYEAAQFSVEHECHHHRSGDIYKLFLAAMQGGQVVSVHDMEYAADCTAAKAVRDKYGFGEDDLRTVFAAFPDHEGTATHPATADRMVRALACFNAP